MAGVAEPQNRQGGGRPHHLQARGPPPPPPPRALIDREKTCPLLLRVFTKEDFATRGKEPKKEVQIYTWKDATLGKVAPEARRRDAKLSFAFVYPDKNGRFVVRQVGTTHSQGMGNARRQDDHKALSDLSFQIGDYLDVAIL
ncbi:hypothetical protein MKW92_035829 [Papaver armeniacum]|nr:hypothetical protein MKW92_035829 [Papaver armeniacum]